MPKPAAVQRLRDNSLILTEDLSAKESCFLVSRLFFGLPCERLSSIQRRDMDIYSVAENNDFFLNRVLTKVEQPAFFRRSLPI